MTQSKIFEPKQRIAKCDPDARLCTIYFDKIKYYQNGLNFMSNVKSNNKLDF